MDQSYRDRSGRGTFIKGAAATGLGVVLAGASVKLGLGASTAGTCTDSVRGILNTLLMTERLAATFYYAALTSPAVMRNSQLCGSSASPANPGLPPGGNPGHVRCLQAALDAEGKHAALLAGAGATSPHTRFYFPVSTFMQMGTSTDPETFLGVLDQLETTSVGAYIAAVGDLASLRHVDLAGLAAGLAGVEAEHRMLGRMIAGIAPANNLTLEREPFVCGGDAGHALQPFLTGKGFTRGATGPIALPTKAQTARVVGKYGTLRVRQFV